jgi:DNA-binding XRE family transcriptional regulator
MSAAERYDTQRPLRGHVFARGLGVVRSLVASTQAAEAVRAGVAWRTWVRWESGRTQAPVTALLKVADRWGVDVNDLLVAPGPERRAALRLDAEVRRLVIEHGPDLVSAAVARAIGR